MWQTSVSVPRPTSSATVRVGPQGRLVIPAELRAALGIEPGDTLVARAEDGQLVLERRAQVLGRLRAELRGRRAGSAVDELIAERREEARREEAERAGGA
jgi:AbrB family looped-hinge helix DNA binding protein